MKERFTTTLSKDAKKQLSILSFHNRLNINEYLEILIKEKYDLFIGGIENEKNN